MLYEKLKKAWEQADVDAYKALHHEDFTFTFHSTGRVMTRDDMTDQDMKGMMMTVGNTIKDVSMKMMIFLLNMLSVNFRQVTKKQ